MGKDNQSPALDNKKLAKRLLISAGLIIIATLIYYKPIIARLIDERFLSKDTLSGLTVNPKDLLKNTNDRTNFLLLGKGGEGHQAGDLTDSIQVISYDHQTQKITVIGVPRDLWVDSLKAKINTAYYYGEKREKGKGLSLSKASIEEVLGLPIHYSLSLDFSLFTELIDLVGGVTIDVPTVLDDYQYPIAGRENALPIESRYEHLHFDPGVQTLNGDRALKYVRSRHSQGDEGTDFARSRRQRQVLLGFRDSVIKNGLLLNPQKLTELIDLYSKRLDTDLDPSLYPALLKLALTADTGGLKTIPLVTAKENPQFSILEVADKTKYQNQYVLIAKDNNWNALKQYIQNGL